MTHLTDIEQVRSFWREAMRLAEQQNTMLRTRVREVLDAWRDDDPTGEKIATAMEHLQAALGETSS